MEVKVILEENKTSFEEQIKEYLNNGYKIEASNVSIIQKESNRPLKVMEDTRCYKNLIVFYALLKQE